MVVHYQNHALHINKISEMFFTLTSPTESISISCSESEVLHTLIESAYRLALPTLISTGHFHLHCSYVLYQGKAILFTGPSGIGKTTQAELWRDYLGATIVNGDASLIQKQEGGFYALGAPVHGSSPYCEERSAPIAALVTLEQAKENIITPMESFQALSYCLPEIFLSDTWPDEVQEKMWENVDHFFQKIPVYHLCCRPDREAVELVRDTVISQGT